MDRGKFKKAFGVFEINCLGKVEQLLQRCDSYEECEDIIFKQYSPDSSGRTTSSYFVIAPIYVGIEK